MVVCSEHFIVSSHCQVKQPVERLHVHQGELLVALHHVVSSRKSAESWLMWRLRLETILLLRICRSGNLSVSRLLSVSVLGCCSPLQWMSSVSGAPLTHERLPLSEEVGKGPLRSAQHVFLVKQKFLHPHPTSRITPPAPALALGLTCPFPACWVILCLLLPGLLPFGLDGMGPRVGSDFTLSIPDQ